MYICTPIDIIKMSIGSAFYMLEKLYNRFQGGFKMVKVKLTDGSILEVEQRKYYFRCCKKNK